MKQQHVNYDSSTKQIICRGVWDLGHFTTLKADLKKLSLPSVKEIDINGKDISNLDSSGALLIIELQNQLEKKGVQVNFVQFSEQASELLTIVKKKIAEKKGLPKFYRPRFLAKVGIATIEQLKELKDYLSFIGKLSFEALRLMSKPSRWRWDALTQVIYDSGFLSLTIIAILSFLIGVVLAYQMGQQLKNYGADIFIVDLLGLAVLREFGPLITAIMVSGRTGSAFTATIGMMKLNQEIDALNTLSVTPYELLILPRIIGLFISLPLITMWADIFGVFGGMVMTNNYMGINFHDFLSRFQQVTPLRSLVIGLGKAPVFALLIASIGCFEGMLVKNSAASVGQNTTRSVVLSIFFIIVVDAAFSIILSKMKL